MTEALQSFNVVLIFKLPTVNLTESPSLLIYSINFTGMMSDYGLPVNINLKMQLPQRRSVGNYMNWDGR